MSPTTCATTEASAGRPTRHHRLSCSWPCSTSRSLPASISGTPVPTAAASCSRRPSQWTAGGGVRPMPGRPARTGQGAAHVGRLARASSAALPVARCIDMGRKLAARRITMRGCGVLPTSPAGVRRVRSYRSSGGAAVRLDPGHDEERAGAGLSFYGGVRCRP